MKSTAERASVPRAELYDMVLHEGVERFVKLYGDVHIKGEEVLQEQAGGFILTPAHRSKLDILATGILAHRAVGAQVHFMGKQELWTKWYMRGTRRLFTELGAFPVDRSRVLPESTEEHIGNLLAQKGVICIFPEGTRMTGDIIQPGTLKKTVGLLSAVNRVPLIPVGIAGTEKGARKPITMAVGEPVDPNDFLPREPASELQIRQTRKPIMAALYPRLQAAQDEAVAMRLTLRSDEIAIPSQAPDFL